MGFSTCWKCKSQFWMPDDLEQAARRDSNIGVFCAHGHRGVFTEGETEEAKLRRERDRLQQRLAEKDDTIVSLERRRAAAVGQVTKIKNRVGHGVCPCCNRTFENVARHMMSKHPTFTAEAVE